MYFTACGSFTERARRGALPKDYDVAIEEGGFVLFGRPFLSSAIKAPASSASSTSTRTSEYSSRRPTRPTPASVTGEKGVWESAGLKVVQVREAAFEGKLLIALSRLRQRAAAAALCCVMAMHRCAK